MLSIESVQSEELSTLLSFVNTHMLTSLTDKEGFILDVSDAFCKVSGYSREELIGRSHNIIRHPDSPKEMFRDLWKTISAGKEWQGEIKNRAKDGTTFWVITSIFPHLDSDGNIIGYVSLRQNITARKAIQEQKTIVIEQSKDAALGEMISMIVHQWMQPLSAISTLLATAEYDLELDTLTPQSTAKLFSKINDRLDFLTHTVNDFRNFYRKDTGVETSISEILNFALKLSKPMFTTNNIDLIIDEKLLKSDEDTKIVTLYKNDLVQVILNLIKNSIDAHKENQTQKAYIEITLSREDDTYLLELKDNAGGIPQEHLEKVFDNDFSTKGEKGSGLGLYMSRMIVQEHIQGNISVCNSQDGAIFTITMPSK